jgi:hypothetical protein
LDRVAKISKYLLCTSVQRASNKALTLLDMTSCKGNKAKPGVRRSSTDWRAISKMNFLICGFVVQQSEIHAFFAQHCPRGQFGQQPADQLPWFHIVTLLTKLRSVTEREWYASQAVQHGWSRTTLELNIKNHFR